MYLSLIGKPTDEDLERYPAVHLTGPHEWYPSVLDFTHPSGDGEPPWSNDSDDRFGFDPNLDEFGEYTQRVIQTLSILDDSSLPLTPCSTIWANQHVLRSNQYVSIMPPLTMKNSGLSFGWINVENHRTVHPMGCLHTQYLPYEKHLKSSNPALVIPRRHEPVANDMVFSDTPAVDSGVKQAQVFVGWDTLVADAYPM